MNRDRHVRRGVDRLLPIRGEKDAVSFVAKDLGDEVSRGRIILDEQYGLGRATCGSLLADGLLGRRAFDAGQIDAERGAASDLAVRPNVTAALLDDSVDGCQSEAGALAFRLGREE